MAKDSKKNVLISLVNSQNNKQYPVISLVKSEPEFTAVVSKLHKDRNRQNNALDNNNQIGMQSSYLDISKDIMNRAKDYESIMALFPDIELSCQILISSIMSPKDMTSANIIYTNDFDLLPSEVNAALMNIVKELSDNTYKIKEKLPDILKAVLFESGSYPVAIIPESSIDNIINGDSKITMESMTPYFSNDKNLKGIGILGPVNKKNTGVSFSLESIFSGASNYNASNDSTGNIVSNLDEKDEDPVYNDYVHITDNFNVLKMPKALEKIQKQKINDILNNRAINTTSFESITSKSKKLNAIQMRDLVYKSGQFQQQHFKEIKEQTDLPRTTIGEPLELRLPPESVIPIFVPGEPKNKVGYYVLLDSTGNPLSRKSVDSQFGDLQGRMSNAYGGGGDFSSMLTGRVKEGLLGKNCKATNFEDASKVYADIVEKNLLNRLKNGVYGENVSIAKNTEVYRIMLARALANQYTQILFIPSDLLTYFAYKYNDDGIGKSLLDDGRLLNSLRAMVMFARVLASIKNSIGRTNVAIKFDERDPNPEKTLETAMTEVTRTRQQVFPLGVNNPVDLLDWVQKAGLQFTMSGHPSMPDTNIEFTETNSNYVKPDSELDDELKKRSIQTVGLSPETVDNGFAGEFATTAVQNNLLLSKRVIQIGDAIAPHLTHYYQSILKNDGNFIIEAKAVIRDNLSNIREIIGKYNFDIDKSVLDSDDELVHRLFIQYVDNLQLKFPQPNSATLDNQMAEFDKYSEALDKLLDQAWLNSDLINSGASGEIANDVGAAKAAVKAYFLRKFCADNNILTELADLTSLDRDDKPTINILEIQSDHINALVKSMILLRRATKPVGAAADKDLEKINNGEEMTETGGSSDSSSSDDTATDDGGASSDENEDDAGDNSGEDNAGADDDFGFN